ncbi:VWA domain-containing protein [Methanosarcina sp. DH1]|uniref:VWA domain-containing protein n=1 Tax=Methanosarcina sp. DH1 TaxID=2605695 RepID=UPI001E4C3BD0|nr:VWA domain-containing protein [Methanosarcina sp. DH1]MCC4766985.1 VWA domain-containing protein [Methanosarcina sp. DH1]
MQELKKRKEDFEGIHRLGSSLSFSHAFNPSTILNIELRGVLATPRKIPRQVREEIAEILVYELFSEEGYEIKDVKLFMSKFGAFYPIFLGLRDFGVWAEIKTLAGANNLAGVFILRALLEEIFTLLDDYGKLESEFSKKFARNLEKSLKALRKLIDETQSAWERNRIRDLEENSWLQENPNTSNQQATQERRQESPLEQESSLTQENFLKEESSLTQENSLTQERSFQQENSLKEGSSLQDLEHETWENPDIQTGNTAGSERLASMTLNFMSSEKAGEALDSVIEESIAVKIEELIPVLEDHLEMLEILSMLFPGRAWDYSLRALHREYFGNLEKYAALLRKSSSIHEILEQVGRIELEYGSKKLSLSPYSKSEVHSVTLSGDIQTLLPAETVKLKNPLLKRKFYADMLEGKLLTYQLKGENWNSDNAGKKRKGPVVALVDTSASMRGSPELLAKAVVLAVTRRMLTESRDVKVILFSSKWQTVEIELTNKKRMGEEFLEFLKFTFGGGTDFNTALRAGLKAMKNEKSFEGADLLFLTDGYSELSEKPLIREWNEIKAERRARIFSLIIGNYDAGGLQQISDHTYLIGNAENWDVAESPASFVKAISKPYRF